LKYSRAAMKRAQRESSDSLPVAGLVGVAGGAPVGRFLDFFGARDQRFLGELLGLDFFDQFRLEGAQAREERIEVTQGIGFAGAGLELADAPEDADLVPGVLGVRLDEIGVLNELGEARLQLGDLCFRVVIGFADDVSSVVLSGVLVNPAFLVDEPPSQDLYRDSRLVGLGFRLGRGGIRLGGGYDRVGGDEIGRGDGFGGDSLDLDGSRFDRLDGKLLDRLGGERFDLGSNLLDRDGLIRRDLGIRSNRLRRFRQLELDRFDIDRLLSYGRILGLAGGHGCIDLSIAGFLLGDAGVFFLAGRFQYLVFDLVDHSFFHRAHAKPPMRRESLAVFRARVTTNAGISP
jgi:hypothetical protein